MTHSIANIYISQFLSSTYTLTVSQFPAQMLIIMFNGASRPGAYTAEKVWSA